MLRYYIITLYKQEKTINNYKTSFSRVSNAIPKPSSKIVGSKIVLKKSKGVKVRNYPLLPKQHDSNIYQV